MTATITRTVTLEDVTVELRRDDEHGFDVSVYTEGYGLVLDLETARKLAAAIQAVLA
jgi:hypothetical protein